MVGQIIPFNFPLLMAAWKIAPALAAGNCTVIKPASPTPWSILKLMEVIGDVVPSGVINVVNGPGAEIGMGEVAGAPFYINRDQYARWGQPQFVVDVAPGAAEGFSLEGLEGVHFVTRTR